MMDKLWDVFGVGTAAVDDLLIVDQFPIPDTKMPVSETHRYCGGQTAVAMITAARHGARAAFCAVLGSDPLSRFTIRSLQKEGVDCTSLIRQSGSGPIYSVIIVVPSLGSRTILYNTRRVVEPQVEEIRPEWITSSRCVFFDQNVPHAGLHIARLANAAGIPVIADIEKTNLPHIEEILARIDHLIISEGLAKSMTGKEDIDAMLTVLAASARTATVITSGVQGCWYMEGAGKPVHFPAYPVDAQDTTGCGDVFHGAYAAAIARAEPIRQAVSVASAAAAMKASSCSGPAGIPTLAAALDMVTRHAPD